MHDRMSHSESTLNVWAFRFLCAAVFSVAFSLPLGRVMVVLCLLMLGVDCIKQHRRPVFPLVAWCWLAFLLVAILTSAFGVDPERSFGKLDKLLWFLLIPMSATLVRDRSRVRKVLGAFVAGAGVLSLEIVIWRPIAAWITVRNAAASGEAGDYLWEITDLGSMTDGQTLMLAIVALVGIMASRWGAQGVASFKRLAMDAGGLLFLSLGLIVNLKRGSWICTFFVIGLFMALRMKLRYLFVLGVIVIGFLLLPPVFSRFCDLRQELDVSRGGRIVMWTRLVPTLVKAHPFGIGYRALTETMMQEVAQAEGVHIEGERNHVHSNPLQILVATGWIGLAVFILWMGVGVTNGVQRILDIPRGSPDRALAVSLALMFVGLILNGLVEYNFGDGELVVLYAVVMGVMGTAWNAMPSELSSA